MSVNCPSCNNINVHNIGVISPSNVFAARTYGEIFDGGSLYRCSSCELFFKWPRMSIDKLNSLYARCDHDDNNKYQLKFRMDWQITEQMLGSSILKRTILDVGCYVGGFLNYLKGDWILHGVEINSDAAKCAEKLGIKIVAEELKELSRFSQTYDAIVCHDIIEHIESPFSFLEQMTKLVTKNGVIVVSSGNTSALSWKIMGSKYYYCTIAEHLSFINPTWCFRAATNLGLVVVQVKKFSHRDNIDLRNSLNEALKNLLFKYFPRITAKIRQIGFGGIDVNKYPQLIESPPIWRTAQDHFIVMFRKK